MGLRIDCVSSTGEGLWDSVLTALVALVRITPVVRWHTLPDNIQQLHVLTTFHSIMQNQRLLVQF